MTYPQPFYPSNRKGYSYDYTTVATQKGVHRSSSNSLTDPELVHKCMNLYW